MKNAITFLLFVFCATFSYSQKATQPTKQCITSASEFIENNTYVFQSVNTAQCSNCYDWDINNASTSTQNSVVGNLKIVSSDMNQNVSIQILAPGPFSIQLTYFTETGCHTCNFEGTAIEGCKAPEAIDFTTTLDSQYNLVLALPTIPYDPMYDYIWEATYSSGPNVNLTVYSAKFPSCPHIMSITLTVRCKDNHSESISLTKSYPLGTFCDNNELRISNNPVKDKINFVGDIEIPFIGKIYNMNGEIIREFNQENYNNIDVSNINKGIYIVKIFDNNNNELYNTKIIKE